MADDSPGQSFIIRLPSLQARKAMAIVQREGSPYSSISELVSVALENQIGLEAEAPAFSIPRPQQGQEEGPKATLSVHASLNRSTPGPTLLTRRSISGPFGDPIEPSPEPLSSFTNRLSPLIVGPRVLAGMTADGGPVTVEQLGDEAASAARAVGLRLHAEDRLAGRRGRDRRSTGWPIGEDDLKSLNRFRNSFLLRLDRGRPLGPLVDLGLVTVIDGNAVLTEAGGAFATHDVPAIDDPAGIELLTDGHRDVLINALMSMPGERVELTAFLQAMRRAGGDQDQIDREIALNHNGWTEAQVVSHRAAVVGRLRDLNVIDVEQLPAGKAAIVAGAKFGALRPLDTMNSHEDMTA